MKSNNLLSLAALLFCANWASAQQPALQYYRGWNQDGINVFEPSKADSVEYTGFKIRIGGSFTQDYQNLTSTNKANYVRTSATNAENKNFLYGIIKSEDSTSSLLSGFNLAMANLNFDVQIGDGIRVCLENYMSARHHNEFWVKGGYIQIDKLPMFNNPDWYTKYFRVRIGHMEVNYGDTHFRRSDGGNAIFNPFADNNIMDEFATEIGGEIYVYPVDGFMAMVGLTNGLIRNNVRDYDRLPVIGTGKVDSLKVKNPSIVLKAAYDKTMSDFRLRLSASLYHNNSSPSLTLFGGDRTGSAYFGVLEAAASTNGTAEAFSGRFNPGLSNKLTAVIFNPFLKYKGIEFLGTYESAKGKTVNESPGSDRKTTQVAAEVVYRFLKNEQVFVGFKYNTVTSRLSGDRKSVV